MPIDLATVVGASLPTTTFSWSKDTVILYHLAIGAGNPPVAPRELNYTYERGLRVLPTFAVIPPMDVLRGLPDVPGLSYNPALVLHGEHEVEIYGEIPASCTVHNTGRIAAVYDKRKAAVIVVEIESRDGQGKLLFLNRCSAFMRGEGGFGGPPGPRTLRELPDRPADMQIESPTLPQQALLYRLCGDKNPLHADPEFAKAAGFERPILHGLCSFGIVAKAVVDHCLDGDVSRLRTYDTRFREVVYPGETIVTSLWKEEERILVQARVKERQTLVLSNAAITIH